MARSDHLRHTSEEVGRALRFQRSEYLGTRQGPPRLRWAARVIDWAHDHLPPWEFQTIKASVDASPR